MPGIKTTGGAESGVVGIRCRTVFVRPRPPARTGDGGRGDSLPKIVIAPKKNSGPFSDGGDALTTRGADPRFLFPLFFPLLLVQPAGILAPRFVLPAVRRSCVV